MPGRTEGWEEPGSGPEGWTGGSNEEGGRQTGNVGSDEGIEGLEYQAKKCGLCLVSLGYMTSDYIGLLRPPKQSTTNLWAKQQKFISPRFWKLEVQDQGVGRWLSSEASLLGS